MRTVYNRDRPEPCMELVNGRNFATSVGLYSLIRQKGVGAISLNSIDHYTWTDTDGSALPVDDEESLPETAQKK